MDLIRTFIGVELPGPVRAALADLVDKLTPRWPRRGIRWVKPDNMHLTLRFLGDTETGKLPALRAGLDEVAGGVSPFELQLHGMDCFPNAQRPEVVWVGLQDTEERLLPLQKGVEQMVQSRGWKREKRPFRSHLTLGRVRGRTKPPEGEWMVEPEELAFRVERVHLIESQLKPSGAEYRSLHQTALGVD